MHLFTFLLLTHRKRSYPADKWQIKIKQLGRCGVNYFVFTCRLKSETLNLIHSSAYIYIRINLCVKRT